MWVGNFSKNRSELRGKSGIYSFINKVDGKRYIGSAKDLNIRFFRHIKNINSNIKLQRAFKKYGMGQFTFVVYAFADYSLPSILELETLFITYFPRDMLYNFKFHATTMLGYKHREETKALISKPGVLNPMFGKTHTEKTKALLSSQKSNPLAQ